MEKRSILIVSFILLSFHVSFGQGWDIKLLDNINSPVKKADKTWRFVSNTTAPLAIATPVAMLITGLATHNKELRIKSYEVGISLIAASCFSIGMKYMIQRPRPFETYPNLITQKASAGGYSFPSGHTTSAFAMATSLSLSFPKWYVIVPSFLYASAVAYSRLYLGVHYPSDIIAGAFIGAGTAFLTFQIQKCLNKKKMKLKDKQEIGKINYGGGDMRTLF